MALVIGTLNIGGAETQLCRLAFELSQRGHTVKLFCIAQGGPLADELERHGIPYYTGDFRGFNLRNGERRMDAKVVRQSLMGPLRFWRALAGFEPDVCQAFLPWAYMLAMPGAALARVPVRVAGRRSLPSHLALGTFERNLQAVSVAASQAVIANSTEVARDTARTEPTAKGKITVIPNGVDLPDQLADPAISPPVGIVIANLRKYKGHIDLISAMGEMSDPPVVRLIGEGAERSMLEELAQEEGLGQVVRFEGSIPNARELYAGAQFAVLPSHQEGMPNSVMEAMAYGLPVVATAVGGVTDLIDDGVNGILVPPHDPTALRNAIERLVGDPDLRVRLGTAARLKISAFSWSRCADAYLDLYQRLHPRGRGPRRAGHNGGRAPEDVLVASWEAL